MEQCLTKINERSGRGVGDVACFEAYKYLFASELIPITSGLQSYLENKPTFIFKQHD
jgi:hypothetical protein